MKHVRILGLACAVGCGAIALLPAPSTASDQERAGDQQERAWRTLRKLVGQWHASEGGRDTRTDYRLIANGNFLAAETVSVSPSEQDVHRDWEIFSYDAGMPTGGKPNRYGDVRPFDLPNSRLVWNPGLGASDKSAADPKHAQHCARGDSRPARLEYSTGGEPD